MSPTTAIVGKPSKRVKDGEQTVENMYPQRVILTSASSSRFWSYSDTRTDNDLFFILQPTLVRSVSTLFL